MYKVCMYTFRYCEPPRTYNRTMRVGFIGLFSDDRYAYIFIGLLYTYNVRKETYKDICIGVTCIGMYRCDICIGMYIHKCAMKDICIGVTCIGKPRCHM